LQSADVKLVVFVPDFHNPLGVTLSDEKRQRVASLAAAYSVPVVEDDAYSRLRFAGEALPPIQAYDSSGYVFYMGSFSKMLAPGLRMGWLVVPPELQSTVTVLRESIDLETSTLLQRATGEFLQRGYLTPHLEQLNASHQRRADALMTALETHLGDIATWTEPEGGLFSWCVLPDALNTWELLDDAIQAGVIYIPGGAFAVQGDKSNTMRLNFSKVAPAQFDEGLRRLRGVINNYLS
jgi:2-aminoadipate transaminase